MKKRPTIALACILKNEAHNIGPLIQSFAGCVDAMYFTDTGSTDGSVDILNKPQTAEIAGCPIHVSHFVWIKDFSAARQFNFDQVDESIDYIIWADLDDVLSDKDAFIKWRDNTMATHNQWLVNYNYAYGPAGKALCTFFRERVIKNNYGFNWKFFVHEGLVPDGTRKVTTGFAPSFTINHLRTDADIVADKARNLHIFQHHLSGRDTWHIRMEYYYGKELYDAGKFTECVDVLQSVCSNDNKELELHDRVMGNQYLCMALQKCGKWAQALNIGLNTIQLEPNRPELYVCIADSFVHLHNLEAAKVFYNTAKSVRGGTVNGAIYTNPETTQVYPYHQLAQLYIREGNDRAAQIEVDHLKSVGVKVEHFEAQIKQIKELNDIPNGTNLTEVEDIVITTPPQVVTKDWDELTLAKEGLGGSETACVELARLLKKHTGRPVKVFMNRQTSDIMPSGVEYLPVSKTEEYFRSYKPARHIAWRHNSKLTSAPTYVWSHDLLTPTAQYVNNYEKLWCLTEFHKGLVSDLQGIPEDKIDIVNNGIDPEAFKAVEAVRNPNKVIFSSSPDRGWERTIEICKRAREKCPDLELHLFYGTGNMRKMGMEQEANKLDALIYQNDFVKYHGFVSKAELIKHFKESAVWLYPADFIETSCITAMEALCAGCYPIARNIGALPCTLEKAESEGMATVLDSDASCDAEYDLWAESLVSHLKERSFEKVKPDLDYYSWETRLGAYLQSMGL